MKKSLSQTISDNFNLNGITEVYFWKSEWESFDPHDLNTQVSPYYLIYRGLYFFYFLGSLIQHFECSDQYENSYWILFLTNQTFTIQLIHSAMFFCYILYIFIKQRKRKQRLGLLDKDLSLSFHTAEYRLPMFCQALWIILNITQVLPYFVTLVYWAILYGETVYTMPCKLIHDTLFHAGNSIVATIDTLIIAVPIKAVHAIFPIIVAFCYSLFTAIYEFAGGEYYNGRYLYSILDWKTKPVFAIGTCVGGIIGGLIGHICFSWGLFKLRIFIKSNFMGNKEFGNGRENVRQKNWETRKRPFEGSQNNGESLESIVKQDFDFRSCSNSNLSFNQDV